RDGRLRAEACDLAQGMHPRVGEAGTLGQDVFASDPSNGQRQCALDRGRPGLDLPPGELGAVIGQDQFEIAHDDCLESSRVRLSSNFLPIFTKLYLAHRTEASGLGKGVSYTISFKQRPGTKSRSSASEHKNETWRPYFAYHRLISRSLLRS